MDDWFGVWFGVGTAIVMVIVVVVINVWFADPPEATRLFNEARAQLQSDNPDVRAKATAIVVDAHKALLDLRKETVK